MSSEVIGGGTVSSGGSAIRAVALDLDGVVWRGSQVLPGAREALEDVLRRGLDLRYVSNNSTAHRETVSERLAGTGLPAGTERVLTSGFVTGRWLRDRLPAGSPVLVIGEDGLMRELREAGFAPYRAGEAAGAGADEGIATGPPAGPGAGGPAAPATDAATRAAPAAAVVVGMDRSFSYQALAAAQEAILGGALFVATNRDATFPTPNGVAPGAGSMVAAVATAAQREPVMMGKPGLALAETLAAVTGVAPAETVFVGDRLSTDIAMGREAGMVTVLVLTGITSETDLERARASGAGALPDHVLPGLTDLPRLLDDLGV
ncbi:MAG: HAD-IIA family hydrolase [Thermoleophilia bacterium]|nr:HAD-IIA family hydrolase [Thermoleophilia bacterium]